MESVRYNKSESVYNKEKLLDFCFMRLTCIKAIRHEAKGR